MNNTERKRIKPQLLKCAKENENRGTFTGYVIVSSVCRAAVERIEELEADIKLLEQRGSDILKELLDKNKRCIELEKDKAYAEEQLDEQIQATLKLQKENAELKGIKDVATLIRANNDTVVTLMQLNNKLVSKSQQLTKAKEILKDLLLMAKVEHLEDRYESVADAEQFLKEIEK